MEERERFARVEPGDARTVALNGIELTKGEVEAVIGALRRSERLPYESDGRPFRDAGSGGGVLEFRRREAGSPELPTVRFWVLAPSAHHGPAFARAIARPLALLRRLAERSRAEPMPLGPGVVTPRSPASARESRSRSRPMAAFAAPGPP